MTFASTLHVCWYIISISYFCYKTIGFITKIVGYTSAGFKFINRIKNFFQKKQYNAPTTTTEYLDESYDYNNDNIPLLNLPSETSSTNDNYIETYTDALDNIIDNDIDNDNSSHYLNMGLTEIRNFSHQNESLANNPFMENSLDTAQYTTPYIDSYRQEYNPKYMDMDIINMNPQGFF